LGKRRMKFRKTNYRKRRKTSELNQNKRLKILLLTTIYSTISKKLKKQKILIKKIKKRKSKKKKYRASDETSEKGDKRVRN